MTNSPFQRWIALLVVPVFTASMLAACHKAGEDTGASSGTSSGGSTQSGGGKATRSERQVPGTNESSGERPPSR